MGTAIVRRSDPGRVRGSGGFRRFWRSLGTSLQRVGRTAGRGAAWLFRNRHYVSSGLNGAVGHRLARGQSRFAIRMGVRLDGRNARSRDLRRVLFAGDGHVVLFTHGLMANERCWLETLANRQGMGPALARDLGITPLYLRYNSGLHISENGRRLAYLMEQLLVDHGAAIRRLTLIGHSMGGLVVRSAGQHGRQANHRWIDALDSVVLLGTPNEGSYIEQLAHLAARGLTSLSRHTRAVATVMNGRSDGIKDLRLGLLFDQDWQRPDAHRLRPGQRTPAPRISGVDYHVMAATLANPAASPVASWLGSWFGDGLVGLRSAAGSHVHHHVFPRTSHLGLIFRPEVHQRVADAIRRPAGVLPTPS